MTHANFSAGGIPDHVVNSYMRSHKSDRAHANAIFAELKKFFYVASIPGVRCSPSRVVDEAWHVFLEHEAEYREYFALTGRKPLNHIVQSEPSLSAYSTTRSLIGSNFSEPDRRYWPHQGDVSTCAPCNGE
jgi:hypothetical protein